VTISQMHWSSIALRHPADAQKLFGADSLHILTVSHAPNLVRDVRKEALPRHSHWR
jgi:hypothetical protein